MTEPDWGALRAGITGRVLTPDVPEYDDARRPAIANFHDVRPEAVVQCATTADVVETIAFAARFGLPLAPRSGGHCFAGRSSTRGIVLDVARLATVSVAGEVVTVGAGIRLGPLYDALASHGATLPAGCGPTVGVAGLTLGGGLGILGRAYGLTSDRLIGAEVVLADGRTVRCDDERDPDLFWALRGAGGGRFAVATSLDFVTVPAPELTVFHLVWPATDAGSVVEAWQSWAPAAPDELAASLLIRAAGAAEEPALAHVFGTMIGTESDAKQLLDELVVRVGREPDSMLTRELSNREAKRFLVELFPAEEGEPQLYSKSEFFERRLPAAAIAELLARLGSDRPAGETRTLDFSPWGGAYNRVPAGATAFAHRSARFLLKHEAVVPPERADAARRWLTGSWSVVHPWGTGGVYPNFPDPDLDDWDPAYFGPNLDRLRRVKAAYDPNGVFGQAGRSMR